MKEHSNKKLTPMMAQWEKCKEEAKGALLLFRLGDFYEAFHDDAKILSEELDLILTQRQGVPMSGVPWHHIDGYIDRLVQKGHRIALAEQVGNPSSHKGLMERKVTRIITRGTLIQSSLLTEKCNNFIASVFEKRGQFGIALLDVTTAEFLVTEVASKEVLKEELVRLDPKELIVTASLKELLLPCLDQGHLEAVVVKPEAYFQPQQAIEKLLAHFGVKTLDGFGLKGMEAALLSAGALLHYLKEDLSLTLPHVVRIKPYTLDQALSIDPTTASHLELLESAAPAKPSFLKVIDKTKTPMGARRLAQWVKKPLVSCQKICERQERVKSLLHHADLASYLKEIRDLERIMMRIHLSIASPQDLIVFRDSLSAISTLKIHLPDSLKDLSEAIDSLPGAKKLLQAALLDTPCNEVGSGDLFRPGYHAKLDELTGLANHSQAWLLEYQKELQTQTAIKNLKVSYNRLFGYYIEVPRRFGSSMPPSFERKQTLATVERFTTEPLKSFETKVLLSVQEKAALEERLFLELQQQLSGYSHPLLQCAEAIAELDSLHSLSSMARAHGWTCPKIDESSSLEIVRGRHPILEVVRSDVDFIPNDLVFDRATLLLITGPNMAGKSTYLRQVALLVVLAQIGSFVPAESMHLGIVDKLFTRIGASDDLLRGQSTFMVEMSQTAAILHNATSRSLVFLDEIGRGTSTFDGLAIAWSVAEYLISKRIKTLFATHYFELTALEKQTAVKNFHAAVDENGGQISFLYKIIPGKADRSWGVHVAKLAGLPLEVVARAQVILASLEEKKRKNTPSKSDQGQLSLFHAI